jgi:heat shock protein HslJ
LRHLCPNLATSFLALLAIAISSVAAPNTTHAAPRPLWGRAFLATSVRGPDGKSTAIHRPADVDVSFSKSSHGQWVGWEANCNGFGARVRIRGGRMRLGPVVSSAVGCVGWWAREDSWLLRFFEADPHWRVRGTHLRLRSGRRVMTLTEKPG